MPTNGATIAAQKSDIDAQKSEAVHILDLKIGEAIGLKNQGDARMSDVIHELMDERTDVYLQAYAGSLESADMAQALAAMKAATTQMNAVAQYLKTAADFIGKTADLLSASGKIVTTLRGII